MERGEPGHCYQRRAKGTWDRGKSRGRGLRERERWDDGAGQSQTPLVLIQNQLSRGEEGDWKGRVDERRCGEES